MFHKLTSILFVFIILFSGCKKTEPLEPVITPLNNTILWEGLVFNKQEYIKNNTPYFSTIDTSIKVPIDEEQAKSKVNVLDIVYIYNYEVSAPGFMDGSTMSKHWYWDYNYNPLLTTAPRTQYYLTRLNKSHFDSATVDGSKFDLYFSDTSKVYVAPHTIFPKGTCIGGRNICAGVDDCAVNSIALSMGRVFGFVSNNRKGFIYVRLDQNYAWPLAISTFETKVDIVKQK